MTLPLAFGIGFFYSKKHLCQLLFLFFFGEVFFILGFDALWRDQQRYATEYYSMGFRVCIGEVDTFLSKEGMDMQDPLRLRMMSHLQCVGVQRQSAFNVWTTTNSNQHTHQNAQYQTSYWPPPSGGGGAATAVTSPASTAAVAAAGLQYAVYGVLPPSEVVYSGQAISAMPSASGGQPHQQDGSSFKNGLMTGTPPTTTTTFPNGNLMNFATATSSSSTASSY